MKNPSKACRSIATTLCMFFMLATAIDAQELKTIASWDFGSEESTSLQPHGGVHRDQPGPRPPAYPDFDQDNTAVMLDGKGARFSFDDPGDDSPFDFANGDALSLEAWVKVDDLKANENLYVIGKGRTGSTRFPRDNQNWALRVREQGGQARASFLFATPLMDSQGRSEGHWHRWTSKQGFRVGSGWHHLAISYRFGEAKSIRGWIDGVAVEGAWDMGGATEKAPVVDNDAIWIGSSQGGNASNSFRGSLDSIAIHRQMIDDTLIKSRFRRDDAELDRMKLVREGMPELGKLQADRVEISVHESMPAHDRWLNEQEEWPEVTDRWTQDAFLMQRLPIRWDAWGIRDAWKAPVLVRMAADIPLEQGKRRFMLRARGLSRLWVDGQLVATARPITGSPSGEEPMTPIVDPPRPWLRRPGYRQQEIIAEAVVGAHETTRIVLETLVGGKKFRPEPGELCVAISTSDGESWMLLELGKRELRASELTDANVERELQAIELAMAEKETARRRQLARSVDSFWQQRHAAARKSIEENHDSHRSIDAFIQEKIDQTLKEASATDLAAASHFRDSVLPILSEHCFRCHGEKDNGGLKLNSREAFMKGGDSETPAFAPGDLGASQAIARIRSDEDDHRMPPTGEPLTDEQIGVIEAWVEQGAIWARPQITADDVPLPPLVDDAGFLRRLSLDTIGLPPSESELRAFLADRSEDKRARAIDRLLEDVRWADHWVSYWQDVLAENPTLINATLNSTGPFRWFLWDSLRDNKPIDRWVTELLMMRGGTHQGGSAGFGLAGENDAPLASKGQIVASAFLGVELQCARCHDSPYHSTKQKDLYSLAAMMNRKAFTVPKTSMVPAAFFEKKERESLIQATLKPEESVPPVWPFAELLDVLDGAQTATLMMDPEDSRERLAALITGPQNFRFAQVIVNRLWRRMIGAGIVEPPQDWEGKQASHQDMLDWMAEELMMHGYDTKHVLRLILNSQTYQRQAEGYNLAADPEVRFFNAPERRRLSAEQVVDSFYAAAGASIDIEELTFDPDGRRQFGNHLSLGRVQRAWMFAGLNNERDRPSLSLPRAQAIDDVMAAFGWSGARQMPRTDRELSPNVLQPGVLANGTLSSWLTSASYQSELSSLAIEATSTQGLIESLFLRFLGRLPTKMERDEFDKLISNGFADRLVPSDQVELPRPLPPLPRVTWSNHLVPEATTIQNEHERRARAGQPSDPRLEPRWRESYEDVVWSLVNHREFVWIP